MPEKKKSLLVIGVILGLTILLLCGAAAGGAFWWYKAGRESEIAELKKKLNESEAGKTETAADEEGEEETADPYDGWLTYTNSILGYKLKYPPDWKAEEHTASEMDMPTNYVTFKDSSDNYLVIFGLKEAGTDYFITGRTGLGQGEPTDSGAITILGQTYPKTYHLLDGKAKVIWFGGDGQWDIHGYEAYAELGSPSADYMAVDLKGIPEEATAEKIISSLKLP